MVGDDVGGLCRRAVDAMQAWLCGAIRHGLRIQLVVAVVVVSCQRANFRAISNEKTGSVGKMRFLQNGGV